jgi:hypothetical protein
MIITLMHLIMIVAINVPVVYMARDVMILMRANPLKGLLEKKIGWTLKIETFMGPEMATSEASAIWAQKSLDLQGPTLPMVLVMNKRKYV